MSEEFLPGIQRKIIGKMKEFYKIINNQAHSRYSPFWKAFLVCFLIRLYFFLQEFILLALGPFVLILVLFDEVRVLLSSKNVCLCHSQAQGPPNFDLHSALGFF